MIICGSCGNENPDENNYCDQCGVKLINNIVNVPELPV